MSKKDSSYIKKFDADGQPCAIDRKGNVWAIGTPEGDLYQEDTLVLYGTTVDLLLVQAERAEKAVKLFNELNEILDTDRYYGQTEDGQHDVRVNLEGLSSDFELYIEESDGGESDVLIGCKHVPIKQLRLLAAISRKARGKK